MLKYSLKRVLSVSPATLAAMFALSTGVMAADIVVNEFMAQNVATIVNSLNDSADWIELQNVSTSPVALGGWYLTDNPENLTKCALPSTTLDVDQYLIVWADGSHTGVVNGEIFVDFAIKDGEPVVLVEPDGATIHHALPATNHMDDVSFGILPDGVSVGFLASPTPGASNAMGVAGNVTFSVGSRTFTNTLSVTLSAANDADGIYYTVDGSVPTSASLVYDGMIPVAHTTQIRARAYKTGMALGLVAAETYVKLNADLWDFSSDLPIVIVDNYGQGEMPAVNPKQAGFMAVFDRGLAGRSDLTNAPHLATRAGFRRRGESTLRNTVTKPNLAVDAWEDYANEGKDISPFGMPEESDWILYAPYSIDRTLIHNAFIFALANQVEFYSPRTRFVEVFLNAYDDELSYATDYAGVYVLMERIKRDANRVDIAGLDASDTGEPEISGGYILKSDKADPDLVGFQTSRGTPKPIYGNAPKFWFIDPDGSEITTAQRTWITSYYELFEAALWGGNYDVDTGYPRYIDTDSFVDFWLFNIFAKNSECAFNSQFMYKPRGGKLTMGPLWDFDRSMESTDGRDNDPTHWDCSESWAQWNGLMTGQWGYQLFKDPDHWQRLIDRWHNLRQSTLSVTNVHALIDSMHDELVEAQARNFAKWTGVSPRTSWEWEIANMKNWLSNRINWIDGEFLDTPVLSHTGGVITNGFQVSITGPGNAAIYYTVDGSDPRAIGGATAAGAIAYTGPLTLNRNTIVRVRAYDNTWQSAYSEASGSQTIVSSIPWSAVAEAIFIETVPTVSISEVMFHPRAPTPTEAGTNGYTAADFEFIEVRNDSGESGSLVGLQLTDGVAFDFSHGAVMTLDPGEHAVVVNDLAAFKRRYADWASVKIAGEYSGNLNDGGESIVLQGPLPGHVQSAFRYKDGRGWPLAADGAGHSLVPTE